MFAQIAVLPPWLAALPALRLRPLELEVRTRAGAAKDLFSHGFLFFTSTLCLPQ